MDSWTMALISGPVPVQKHATCACAAEQLAEQKVRRPPYVAIARNTPAWECFMTHQ